MYTYMELLLYAIFAIKNVMEDDTVSYGMERVKFIIDLL